MTDLIVAAVPVADIPVRPAPYFKGGSDYPCTGCGCEVWMGPKTKEAADSGYLVYCMFCAAQATAGHTVQTVVLDKTLKNDIQPEQVEQAFKRRGL